MKKGLLFLLALFSFLMQSVVAMQSIGDIKETNFPTDTEGRLYHLGVKPGEVANRILMVGDPNRAKIILSSFDSLEELFVWESNRGFTTYTGTKDGVPVTVMAMGIGMPMMDLAVREVRAITQGPLFIIRLGTCGALRRDIPLGAIVVANRSYAIITNYRAYHTDFSTNYFQMTPTLYPDLQLHVKLFKKLKTVGTFPVIEASDATTDFFYSSQGRLDNHFADQNTDLIDTILRKRPDTGSLQMETYQLFHLAKIHNDWYQERSIRVAACAIVVAQRYTDVFLSQKAKESIEKEAGELCLQALIAF